MKIKTRGMVYDASAQPREKRVAAFTSLFQASSGSCFCTFQCGETKHAAASTVHVYRSRDRGATWSDLGAPFDLCFEGVHGSLSSGEMVEVSPGRLMLVATWFDRSDPARPLFDPVTEGILPSRQLASLSGDDGATWTLWSEIPVPGLDGCASTGPILKWSDGTIAYPFESYKRFDDPKPGRHAAWVIVSRDGGRSFGPPVQIAQHPEHQVFYWDQRLCPGSNPGDYVALFWSHDLTAKTDLNVHVGRGTIAGDHARHEPIRATNIPGQIAAPLLLPGGALLAFVVDRGKPGTLTIWQSDNSGADWRSELVVHVHDERAALTQGKDNIDFAAYWEDMGKWSFGHPAMRLLDDGTVLLAYYAGVPRCLSIHWARVILNSD